MPGPRAESVHLELFPEGHPEWRNKNLEQAWQRFRDIRSEVYRLLEQKRNDKVLRSFMEAVITLRVPEEMKQFLQGFPDLHRLFIVARVDCLETNGESSDDAEFQESDSIPGLKIRITKATGDKCSRCWNWDDGVGNDAEHPELCPRCRQVIESLPTT